MNQEKTENFLKRYHLKHSLPVALTLLSVYFWATFLNRDFLKIAGAIINVAGLAMWWSAKLTLAGNWGMGFGTPGIKQLVTRGIYAKIRHPMYWGIILTIIGLVLLYPEIRFSIVSLLVVVYFFSRMRRESRYLSEKLGEEYRDYARKTWF